MSFPNNRTFMQKHGLMVGVGVVSLIIIIVLIVMFTGKKEEEINGTFKMKPNAKNVRDMDVEIDVSHKGEVS